MEQMRPRIRVRVLEEWIRWRSDATAPRLQQRLPERPRMLKVPIRDARIYSYVLFSEIPEPARGASGDTFVGSSTPRPGGANAHDWLDFLARRR